MEFVISSYRAGHRVFDQQAFEELSAAISDIELAEVEARWEASRYTGVQAILNEMFREKLDSMGWDKEVLIFDPDTATSKGPWAMDFARNLGDGYRVGLEVTFNHAEALAWTTVRLALAHEAQDVLPDARIMAGAIIIGTDQLKRYEGDDGKTKYRMDSAVGTYERLRTMLPKLRYYVHLPLLIIGLRWADGGMKGNIEPISLHTWDSGMDG